MPLSRIPAELATTPVSFRNRIINGDMRIDQRNNGASVTPSGGSYTLDRWRAGLSVASKYSVQQSSVAPAGFGNSLFVTSLSAYSVGASESFVLQHLVEGFNFADLGWGTANAQSVTLSFSVRSSLTGTFGGCLANSAHDRSYPFTYTISTANTWQQITVTIAGDTSGTWVGNTNGIGVRVYFGLGVGSALSATAGSWASGFYVGATGATSVVGTNGATFYITGVQLEAGTVATPFERRDYGRELMMCQRYYYRISTSGATYQSFGLASPYNATQMRLDTIFPVTMRTAPAALDASAASSFIYEKEAGYAASPSAIALGTQSNAFIGVSIGTTGALTAGGAVYHTYSNGTPAYLGFSAEL